MEWLYGILGSLGYHHPLHPPLVHLPIGMVAGAFLFQLWAVAGKRPEMAITARHCSTLALVAVPLAAIAGYLDWQHYYAGAWALPVRVKLFLAGALLGLLCFRLLQRRLDSMPRFQVLFYGLPLLLAAGLGYFGGELVYADSRQAAAMVMASDLSGEQLFQMNCGRCHPHGENTLKPTLPLRGAPQLANEQVFVEYLRNPQARDGSTTYMPAFAKDRLTDREAMQIRKYVIEVLRQQS